MFFDQDIKGNRLPPRTVCLTYDDGPGVTRGDGPGPRTDELGEYLSEQGIGATFFVIGRHAEAHPDLPRRLRAWGHLVGNHSYSHPGLANFAAAGGDVVGEIARTDEVLRDGPPEAVVFLRAPYGNWRERGGPDGADRPTSVVAETLNRSGRFPNYVGPINWDISAGDWECWRRGDSAAVCAERYLARTEQVGGGIVLLHDSSEDPAMRANNRSLEMTRLLVRVLRARGYRFVRLDEIPQVRSATRVTDQIYVRAWDGRFWRRRGGSDEIALADPPGEVFGVVRLGQNRVALRSANGAYLSARPDGSVQADAPVIGDGERLEMEVRADGAAALRTFQGAFFAHDRQTGTLRVAPRGAGAEFFSIQPRVW